MRYQYLTQLYEQCDLQPELFYKWHEKEFSGVCPDALYATLALTNPTILMPKAASIFSAPRLPFAAKVGVVCFNGANSAHHKNAWRAFPDGRVPTWNDYVTIVNRAVVDCYDGNLRTPACAQLRACFPATSTALRQREVVDVCAALRCAALAHMLTRVEAIALLHASVGLGGQCVTNLLMACASSMVLRRLVLWSAEHNLLCNGLEPFIEFWKEYHTMQRRAQLPFFTHDTSVRGSWRDFCYMHLLAGRFYFPKLFGSDEINARAEPNRPQQAYSRATGWSSALFDDIIFTHAEAMPEVAQLAAAEMQKRSPMSLADLTARTAQMGTTGSASAMRKVHLQQRDGAVASFVNPSKGLWLNELAPSEWERILHSPPSLRTQAIAKLEASKTRMLLPGPLQQWLVESVALYGFEDGVYRDLSDVGYSEGAAEEFYGLTRELLDAVDYYVCSDYADFNILHEVRRMQRMWLTLATAMAPGGAVPSTLSPESPLSEWAAAACRWAAASMSNMAAKAPQDADYTQLIRGLWTGWRSTSFINTIMNRCYHRVIESTAEALFGIDPIVRAKFVGDDMRGRATTCYQGLRYLQTLQLCGLEAQASKQALSQRSGEFLRVFAGEGQAQGFLARSISSFTSHDLQVQPFAPSPDRARAMNDTLHMWVRRGAEGSSVEAFRYFLLDYASHARVYNHETKVSHTVSVPLAVLRGSSLDGGLGCARYGEVAPRLSRAVGVPKPVAVSHAWYLEQMAGYGSEAAYQKLSEACANAGLVVPGRSLKLSHMDSIAAPCLPMDVQLLERTSKNTAWAAWCLDHHDVTEEIATQPEPDQEWSSLMQLLLRDNTPGRHANMSTLIDQLKTTALGPMSAVPTALQQIASHNNTSLLATASRLAARSAQSIVPQLQSLATDELIEGALEGEPIGAIDDAGRLPATLRMLKWATENYTRARWRVLPEKHRTMDNLRCSLHRYSQLLSSWVGKNAWLTAMSKH
jgi:hypothetical protein